MKITLKIGDSELYDRLDVALARAGLRMASTTVPGTYTLQEIPGYLTGTVPILTPTAALLCRQAE
jgi:hypothetical protein